jgi:hypothetical protein
MEYYANLKYMSIVFLEEGEMKVKGSIYDFKQRRWPGLHNDL